VHARPAAASSEGGPNPLGQLAEGVRLVFGDPALRMLVGLAWLAAFYEVPEGIAAPYAGSLKGGAVAAGLLLATSQAGAAITSPLFTKKLGPLTRLKWMGPMAVLACAIPRGDGLAPEPDRLDGTVRAVQQLRDVPDRRQHRVRGADPEREAGAGVRPRQCGPGRGSRAGVRPSWSGRRGGTSLDGRGSQWWNRRPYCLRSCIPVAGNVTRRRPSHCETSWPRGLAYQADTYPKRLVVTRG